MGSKKDQRPERFFPLWEREKLDSLLSSLSLLGSKARQDTNIETQLEVQDSTVRQEDLGREMGQALACSTCQVQFENLAEQRLHFKLDWHRYNVKLSLRSRPPLSEQQFDNIVEQLELDEEEEISGSDDTDEEDEAELGPRDEPRLLLCATEDRVVAVHKCLIFDPRTKETPDPDAIVSIVRTLPSRLTWAVFMLGGGHFAGAVFRGKEVWVHKTFHCYTVRAKQGGSQGTADNKSGGSQPKSAGASLRRYNEQQLLQHIQDITVQWTDQLAACHLIFYRAASNNKNVLFTGKNPSLRKGDSRLRNIPFPTKRATFKEVKRVHEVLCRLEVLGVREELELRWKQGEASKSSPKRHIHRSKSREPVVRELPGQHIVVSDGEGEGEAGELVLNIGEEIVGTTHLQEFECNPVKKKGKKSKNNKAQGIQRDLEALELEESDVVTRLQTDLVSAVRSGNSSMLTKLATRVRELKGEEVNLEALINHQFGDSKFTSLHLAAREGHIAVLNSLLNLGADPTIRDKAKKVPYNLAKDKETRNCFRKFMGENPDKFDYKSAQIPPPLDKEAEEEKERKVNEKKKAQRAAKREKEKTAKIEDARIKAEQEEKERFLNLTDREKRALAAERRLMNSGSTVQRQLCFLCALDITGKTPFEYSDNKFCSVKCVKQHRARTS